MSPLSWCRRVWFMFDKNNLDGEINSMLQEHKSYIIKETAINSVVSGLLSVFFAWMLFSNVEIIELWGTSGLAADFFPQTFVITLMSVLALGFITRKRVASGSVLPLENGKSMLPGNIIIRSLFVAVVVTIVSAPVAIFILSIAWNDSMTLSSIYLVKGFYGFMIAMAVTPTALRTALADKTK